MFNITSSVWKIHTCVKFCTTFFINIIFYGISVDRKSLFGIENNDQIILTARREHFYALTSWPVSEVLFFQCKVL